MKDEKYKLLKLTNWLFITMTLAIVCITLILVFLVQKDINDGSLINTSGKQRYLSQKITKTCILFQQNTDSVKDIEYTQIIDSDLLQFESNNRILLARTNSDTILSYLKEIQPYFETICENSKSLIRNRKDTNVAQKILNVEPHFLQKMMKIVRQYEVENKTSLNRLLYYLVFLNIILITVFIFIIFKIIRPVIKENKKNQEIISEQNQKLIKLNKDKDLFIAILAHDLKNPFVAILGFLQLLEDNVYKNEVKDNATLIKIVNDSSKSVYHLLESILEWARFQAGKIPFTPQKLQLSFLCNKTIELLKNNSNNKHIVLEQYVDDSIFIEADMYMANTILRNLVSNAIKFTEPGGSVTINAELMKDQVLVTVSDTGIGMKKESIDKLFDITLLHTTSGTQNEQGTGFGLLFCKDFVEKHNGSIWVESEIGIGSHFKFTLPLSKD